MLQFSIFLTFLDLLTTGYLPFKNKVRLFEFEEITMLKSFIPSLVYEVNKGSLYFYRNKKAKG